MHRTRTKLSAAAGSLVCAASLVAATTTMSEASYPGTDGRLAFGDLVNGNDDIYSVLPNGQGLKRLTTDPGRDLCATYSADGRHIAWCSTAGNAHGGADIWVMKQNGTHKRRVTDLGGQAGFPDFSPSGDSIVFSGRPAGAATPDIWMVGVDGAGLRQLTTSPSVDQFPVFSPDGQQIAFRSNRSGTFQIWVMDADGTDQRQLTFDPDLKDQLPDWSPDGQHIAYAALSPSTGLDIWVMDADGSDAHPVLASADDTFGPAWSPSGDRIAFLNATDNTIETVPSGGGDPAVVHVGTFPAVPAWQPRIDDAD